MKQRRFVPRRRWIRLTLLTALIAAGILATPTTRVATLRSVGQALVASDPVTRADVIVISVDAGGAGVLEAADLVRNGASQTVAVFAEPSTPADLEFARRGVLHYDDASLAINELQALGVANAVRIPTPVDGTTAEGQVLAGWMTDRGFRSVLMITTADHARRTRRVLRRALKDHGTNVTVRPSQYSNFHADSWWHTRRDLRTGIIELQKLLLDMLAHPLS